MDDLGGHVGSRDGDTRVSKAGVRVVRVGRGDRVPAAARLVGGETPNARQAGRAFLERASAHGIDLRYFWGTVRPDAGRAGGVFTQAALIVPQTGRTAMVFLSGPGPMRTCGDADQQSADRVELLRGAFVEAEAVLGDRVHLIQALPSPEEAWGIGAFAGAGMTRLGDLAYLRRPLSMPVGEAGGEWPAGVRMRRVGALTEGGDLPALRRALERTYVDTLDCPGLCALRRTDDVIESHRSAGDFEKAEWWIVEADDGAGFTAEGCVLLSPAFEARSLELVYMGLGPRLRGRGLGARALRAALLGARRLPLDQVSCAVDLSNEPARALYARLGFTEFARRVAFVRPTASGPVGSGNDSASGGVGATR